MFIDTTSSMYLSLKLKQDANSNRYFYFFLPVETKNCINSALYDRQNMSDRRGAQLVPIGIPTLSWKTFPTKTSKILSTRNASVLMMSSSEYLFLESECSLTKYASSGPKLDFCMWGYRLFFSWSWGIVYKGWKNRKSWCFLYAWNSEI